MGKHVNEKKLPRRKAEDREEGKEEEEEGRKVYQRQGLVAPQPTFAALQFTHADLVRFATNLICFSPTKTTSGSSSISSSRKQQKERMGKQKEEEFRK